MPVGFFLLHDRKESLLGVAIGALLAATFIEVAPLFVYSQVSDVTDVLMAGVGAAIGGVLAKHNRKTFALLAEAGTGFWFSLWIAWILAVFGIFLYPFNFRTTGVDLEAAMSALTRMPLLMLYQGSEFQVANEMLRKIGSFLPEGILWSLGTKSIRARNDSGRINLLSILALFLVAVMVEAGQLVVPRKHADLTDLCLETAGGALGMILTSWVLAGGRQVQVAASLAPPQAEAASRRRTTLPVCARHLLTFTGLSLAVTIVTRLPMGTSCFCAGPERTACQRFRHGL